MVELSGVSARYITSAEHGQANVSLDKLERLCSALDIPMAWLVTVEQRGEVDALLAERTETELVEIASWLREKYGVVHKPIVALLGVRGAGKTAVGRALARHMDRHFVELDQQIEALADLSLAEIFSVHGEAYYRRLEFEALNRVIDGGSAGIVATGGGIVTDAKNYARLRQTAITVWLKARPEDHWDRVIKQEIAGPCVTILRLWQNCEDYWSNGRLYTVKLILLSIPADIPLMRSPIKLNVFLPADYM